MAQSIAEQVQEYLKGNPEASNKELYEVFPKVRENTLRHYRSKFAPKRKNKKTVNPNASETQKSKRGRPRKVTSELEERVANLEKQMSQLLATLDVQIGKRGRRVNPIDKRFREMEETILAFLKTKTQNMPTELPGWDELQKSLSSKINTFLANLKK